MRITEGLIKKQFDQHQKDIRAKEDKSVVFEDEVDGYYMYDTRKAFGDLNDYRGVFDTKDEKSLNTAPSVFDRTAIFKTKKETDDQ